MNNYDVNFWDALIESRRTDLDAGIHVFYDGHTIERNHTRYIVQRNVDGKIVREKPIAGAEPKTLVIKRPTIAPKPKPEQGPTTESSPPADEFGDFERHCGRLVDGLVGRLYPKPVQ